MKRLIEDDILGTIEENQRAGNLTAGDARRLNDSMDESLILEIDLIEKRHREEMEKAIEKLGLEKDNEQRIELEKLRVEQDRKLGLA